MKKLIILFGLLLCMYSCTQSETEYDCVITYAIDGIEHTETYLMKASSGQTPTYVYNGETLMIVAVPSEHFYTRKTIYSGALDVKVISFDYKKIRTYDVSGWDGHEIKKKK